MIVPLLFALWGAACCFSGAAALAQEAPPPDTAPPSDEGTQQTGASPAEKKTEEPGLFKGLLDHLSVNGYFKNETSLRYKRPQGFDKILNIFRLESRYTFDPRFQLTGILRAYYDGVYDVEDIDTIAPRIGPRTILIENPTIEQIPGLDVENVRNVEIRKHDLEIKELYLDSHLADLDLRIGRQIVRWGVAEGARVTDEINPLDFQEFILREVSDRYVPLWLVKADYYRGNTTFETIWIPDLTFHKPAPRSSEWEQFQFLPGRETPGSPLRSVSNFKNSEVAFKVIRPMGGWELSASYFYTWDDFPTTFRETVPGKSLGDPPIVTFHQRYTRNHDLGGTFSKSLGPVVIGGEVAYVIGKHFGAGFVPFFGSPILGGGGGVRPGTVVVVGGNILGNSGEVQRDFMKYALQADFSLLGTDLSLQFLQHYIPRHDSSIIQDKFDTVVSLFARRVMLNNLITAQLLTIYFINDTEFLIRPRMEYNLSDHLQLAFGADVLLGRITSSVEPPIPGDFHFVGFFKNNSRIYGEFKYSF